MTTDTEHFVAQCKDAMALALRDLDSAFARCESLIHDAGDDPDRRAWSLVARSNALAYAGRFEQALGTLDEAGTLPIADSALRSIIVHAGVQPLMRLGRLADAVAAARNAVALARGEGAPPPVARAMVSLGAALRALGSVHEAAEVLQQAADLMEGRGPLAGAATSNRAECLLDLDRFDEALAAFHAAAAEFDTAGWAHAAAIARGNAADVLGRLGRVDPAIAAFEEARRRFEAAGAHLDVARLLCEEADMLAHAGALRAARDRFVLALRTLEAHAAGQDLARARVALASVLLGMGDTPAARRTLHEAQLSAEQLPELLQQEIRLGLARCAIADGQPVAARTFAAHALEALQDHPARQVHALLVLADADLLEQRTGDALEHACRAAESAERLMLEPLVPLCEARIARAATLSGHHDRAQITSDAMARRCLRTLAQTNSDAARAGMAIRYQPILAERALRMLDLEHPHAHDALLLAASLEAPAANARARRQITRDPSADDAKYLSDKRDLLTERLARLALESGPHRAADADAADLHAELRVLRERLSTATIGTSTATEKRAAAGTIARALPAHAAAIHYFADAEHLSAICITRDASRTHRRLLALADLHALARRIGFIAQRCAESADPTPEQPAWLALAARAADALLAPILAACASDHAQTPQTLTVSGDPRVLALPWAAIAHAAAPVAPRVVLSGRAPALAPRTPAAPSSASPRVAIIAADDDTLPGVRDEASRIHAVWPDAAMHLGGDHRTALHAIASADIVHLATHGVFVPDRPTASRLWIADRWIDIDTLAGSIAPGCTLILSACHAGRGGGIAEDHALIPDALRAAGAGAVIASPRALSDHRAGPFFAALHEQLATGSAEADRHDPAAALARTLAEARRAGTLTPDLESLLIHGAIPCAPACTP